MSKIVDPFELPRFDEVDFKLKLTQKQLDKHIILCDRFDFNTTMAIDYVIVEDEKEADEVGAWYGAPRDRRPGKQYITILPDGSSHS